MSAKIVRIAGNAKGRLERHGNRKGKNELGAQASALSALMLSSHSPSI
jgi:hypothetical protein